MDKTVYILEDRKIRVEWTILKGTSPVREDFRRALVKVFLIGNCEKYLLEATADRGTLMIDIPEGLEPGLYSLEAIWVKNAGHPGRHDRDLCRSMKQDLFAITEFEEEATNLPEGTVVLKAKSSTATYGYDGLSSYELAVLRGEWNGTEGEWLKHQRYVSVLDGRGDSEVDTMSQKSITEELVKHDTAIEDTNKEIDTAQTDIKNLNDEMDEVQDRLAYIPKESFLSSEQACDYHTEDNQDELTVSRAIKDRFGRIIDEHYVTRETVKDYTQEVVDGSKIEIQPGSVQPEDLSPAVQQMIESAAAQPGHITNLPDEEDLTVTEHNTLQFKDREYNPYNYSGMGKVYLRKHIVNGTNMLTQHMMRKPNTIYVIRYDYCLGGETIEVPEGCVLEFDGGSIRNGTIKGNSAFINSNEFGIFRNIRFKGKIDSDWNFKWFVKDNLGKTDISCALNNLIDDIADNQLSSNINFPVGKFLVEKRVVLHGELHIKGTNNFHEYAVGWAVQGHGRSLDDIINLKTMIISTVQDAETFGVNAWKEDGSLVTDFQWFIDANSNSGAITNQNPYRDKWEPNVYSIENICFFSEVDAFCALKLWGSFMTIKNIVIMGFKYGMGLRDNYGSEVSNIVARVSVLGFAIGNTTTHGIFKNLRAFGRWNRNNIDTDKYAFHSDIKRSFAEDSNLYTTGFYFFTASAILINCSSEAFDCAVLSRYSELQFYHIYIEGIRKVGFSLRNTSRLFIKGCNGNMNPNTDFQDCIYYKYHIDCTLVLEDYSLVNDSNLDKTVYNEAGLPSAGFGNIFSSNINISRAYPRMKNSTYKTPWPFYEKWENPIKDYIYITNQSDNKGTGSEKESAITLSEFIRRYNPQTKDGKLYEYKNVKKLFIISDLDIDTTLFIGRDWNIEIIGCNLGSNVYPKIRIKQNGRLSISYSHIKFYNLYFITENDRVINIGQSPYTTLEFYNCNFSGTSGEKYIITNSISCNLHVDFYRCPREDLESFTEIINRKVGGEDTYGYGDSVTLTIDGAAKVVGYYPNWLTFPEKLDSGFIGTHSFYKHFVVWDGSKWLDYDGYPWYGKRVGRTVDRPDSKLTVEDGGYTYYDTTLQKPLWYTNERWIDGLGNSVDASHSGTSSERPISRTVAGYPAIREGFFYFDTTLNKPIWWTGSHWVDATGSQV